jgi:hypothetical protein
VKIETAQEVWTFLTWHMSCKVEAGGGDGAAFSMPYLEKRLYGTVSV